MISQVDTTLFDDSKTMPDLSSLEVDAFVASLIIKAVENEKAFKSCGLSSDNMKKYNDSVEVLTREIYRVRQIATDFEVTIPERPRDHLEELLRTMKHNGYSKAQIDDAFLYLEEDVRARKPSKSGVLKAKDKRLDEALENLDKVSKEMTDKFK